MNLMRNLSRLPKISVGKFILARQCSQQASTVVNGRLVIENLTERELIRVRGEEVPSFLQGLITNDIKHLHPTSHNAIYAMFLNKAGRVLYDSFVYSTTEPNTFLIECDKNVSNELQRHLRLYRVRRKIDIDSVQQEVKVWQIYSDVQAADAIFKDLKTKEISDVTITTDPRLKHLGIRLLASSNKTFSDLSKLFQTELALASDKNNFRALRYDLGVAEGVLDLPPGKCFPLEANCDLLNGVSFHKGCYIGQELTARVHHTGVIRKRHMPVKLAEPLPASFTTGTVQNEAGANCGTIYGSTADRALGLLRIENVLKARELTVNGSKCFTKKPEWWPQELQSASISIRKDI